MRQAADMGYAFAQAWMASRTRGEESLEWARRAAKQGERDGFRRLGTQEGYLRAMELGCVESMCEYATTLPATDPQRFVWLLGHVNSEENSMFGVCYELPSSLGRLLFSKRNWSPLDERWMHGRWSEFA